MLDKGGPFSTPFLRLGNISNYNNLMTPSHVFSRSIILFFKYCVHCARREYKGSFMDGFEAQIVTYEYVLRVGLVLNVTPKLYNRQNA